MGLIWIDKMDAKYRLFKPDNVVVDLVSNIVTVKSLDLIQLGLCSRELVAGKLHYDYDKSLLFLIVQVALDRTRPSGKVIGIDLIPAEPPRGVATFQGDFLSPAVQKMVKDFISHTIQPYSRRHRSSAVGEVSQPSSIKVGPDAPAAAKNTVEAQVVDVCLAIYGPGSPFTQRLNSITDCIK